ncbi:alpha,alpha-trehalase [Terrimicrobium sacchariphilum]|uniref:Alpha,alpha-trehalase n=1 Tax=Terrimicrobium sacchariphilum TaxID=690879 RepID=A0A146G8G3_TERSA|nr:trehalase family glycosidase [Terrimicrobium sacchariphilum]GAT33602.1 alpha,alpha-trehalase [Terrimicrobium sacchariphilum]
MPPSSPDQVRAFIASHWDDTVRFSPRDDETLIGLPYPYTIPTRKDVFQELYYWDTYFTCLGLAATGRRDLALNNARNLLAEVERFGFVPNGNRTYYLSRSQSPYLAPLVGLVAEESSQDTEFLQEAIPLLKREYEFWVKRRTVSPGLAHHGCHATREELIEFFPTVRDRLGLPEACAEDDLDFVARVMSECETGWDMNSRFAKRCPDFFPVDLNSNLWLYETLLARWTEGEESVRWAERADSRRTLINSLCWDAEQGAWFDYDHVNRRRSVVWNAGLFQPLWVGLATPEQAASVVANALPKLEFDHGITATLPPENATPFQWDHPNMWPPIQHIVYRGLARYGYIAEGRRIAEKYIDCVTRAFNLTGDLWEKYNVADGSHIARNEAGYFKNPVNLATGGDDIPEAETPSMMGWTAGVFIDAQDFLAGGKYWLNPLPHSH